MKAIFVTGGKQYIVEEGQELYVEKLNNEVDSEVVLMKFYMLMVK